MGQICIANNYGGPSTHFDSQNRAMFWNQNIPGIHEKWHARANSLKQVSDDGPALGTRREIELSLSGQEENKRRYEQG